MLPIITDSDLQDSRNDEEVVKLTIEQIIKDFALFGMEITLPESLKSAYHELYDQLEKQIFRLLDTNSSLLLSLLYQIDISEKNIRKNAEAHPEKMLSEVVTEMILERELKKVLTRLYFKKHGY